MQAIQNLLDSFVKKGMATGVSALVYHDGQEAFWGSAGKLDLEKPAPFARDSIPRMKFMRHEIFAPLGMNHTSFHPSTIELARIATLYLVDGG